MAAEPTDSNINPQAPEGQAPAATSGSQATPANGAGEDAAALKAQLDALLKHKGALEADLKKYRDKQKAAEEAVAAERQAAEAKLREQGEHVKLREIAEEKVRALEAQLAEFSADAEIARSLKARKQESVEAAKADPALPAYIKRALDSAKDVLAASDILDEFRASQASAQPAPKQPAPPAPAIGGAPPSPSAPVNLANPSVADLQRLKAENPGALRSLIFGQSPSTSGLSFSQRLAGVGRK